MGLFAADDSPLENADIDCEPQNEYVTRESVSKIDDILDRGEAVHYLAKGAGGGIVIESGGQRTKKRATAGFIRAAATDRRVVCKIPYFVKSEEISIPYTSISTVDLRSGFIRTRLSLQAEMKTYGIDIGGLDEDVCRGMSRFVRTNVTEAGQSRSTGSGQDPTDPLSRLERFRDLKDDGTITEAEFEEHKQKFLDQM